MTDPIDYANPAPLARPGPARLRARHAWLVAAAVVLAGLVVAAAVLVPGWQRERRAAAVFDQLLAEAQAMRDGFAAGRPAGELLVGSDDGLDLLSRPEWSDLAGERRAVADELRRAFEGYRGAAAKLANLSTARAISKDYEAEWKAEAAATRGAADRALKAAEAAIAK
jgi:hypothetical protein